MDHQMLQQRFAALTTAHLADACIRAQVPVRCASALLRAVVPGSRLAGRVCPARHAGSVDAFLEAFENGSTGQASHCAASYGLAKSSRVIRCSWSIF